MSDSSNNTSDPRNGEDSSTNPNHSAHREEQPVIPPALPSDPSIPSASTSDGGTEQRNERLQRLFASHPTRQPSPSRPPSSLETKTTSPLEMTTSSGPVTVNDPPSTSSSDAPAELLNGSPSSSASSSRPSSPPPTREDMVSKGVQFLQSPKVISAPWEKKKAFLLGKGLTEAEVSVAKERANEGEGRSEDKGGGVSGGGMIPASTHPGSSSIPSSTTVPSTTAGPPPLPPRPMVVELPPREPWITQRAMVAGIVTGSMLLSGLMVLCKVKIIPLLMRILQGRRKRLMDHRETYSRLADRMDTTISTLSQSSSPPRPMNVAFLKDYPIKNQCVGETEVVNVIENLSTLITTSMYGHDESQVRWRAAIDSFRGQVRSIKGGLLSRRNFPMYPSTGNGGARGRLASR